MRARALQHIRSPGAARLDPVTAMPFQCPHCHSSIAIEGPVPPSEIVCPISNGTSCSIGASADGRRVKSGQMMPLKMCARSASIVGASACT